MAAVVKKRRIDTKPVCKYGSKCYRKNPQHLQNYRHIDVNVDAVSTDLTKKTGNQQTKRKHNEISDYFGTAKNTPNSSTPDSEDEVHDQLLKKGNTSRDEGSKIKEDGNTGTSSKVDEEQTDLPSPPASPVNVRENITMKFLVEMPEDFYHFWDFCQSLKPQEPCSALEKTLNLTLVGPFDILAGRQNSVKKNKHGRHPNFLIHYRFYYDPPEFQTVIVTTGDSRFHLGYYRDDPKEAPVFVASNSPGGSSKEKLEICGENIFAAVHIYATKQMKSSIKEKRNSIEQLIKSIEKEASKHNLSLTGTTKKIKERQKKVVCPTFHMAGIVVPVDANEVGYRPVPETPGDLRALFKRISESNSSDEREKHFEDLQELITLVQFANDECDYGEGLELGLDLFSYGAKIFHPQIASLLSIAYQLLNRPEFSKIIEAHLKHRRPITECVDELAT